LQSSLDNDDADAQSADDAISAREIGWQRTVTKWKF
jgi:hypothetical protein